VQGAFASSVILMSEAQSVAKFMQCVIQVRD